jgi:hypothetical protein
MIGTPPALFGAAEADQKTASGFSQMRAQAMGRLGLAWGSMQEMFARIYYQAALAAAKNPDQSKEIVVAGSNGKNAVLQLEKLTAGKFGTYAQTDSGFPEGIEAQRQQLTQLTNVAALSPNIAQQLMDSPNNWQVFQRVMGFPELKFQEADSSEKQMTEIEELLMSPPVPPDPMALEQAQVQHAAQAVMATHMGGPPPPPFDPTSLMTPTVAVDELDFHEYEFKKCQQFLSSTDCRRQLAQGNFGGVLNVKLHAKQHQQFMAQQATAMAPPIMKPPVPAKGAPPPQPQGNLGSPNAISAPPGAPGALTM